MPREQFTRHTHAYARASIRKGQLALLAPGLTVGAGALVARPEIASVATGLMTVVSILTALTFSMATTFWTKTIEARRDPEWATNGNALTTLDEARNHLIWTVFVGVCALSILTFFAIFGNTLPPDGLAGVCAAIKPWAVALVSALVTYLVALVMSALMIFNRVIPILTGL